MPDVIMPRLSDSMEEGTILRWLKTNGETVQRGEDLLEIETDKATMTYEADASGVLSIGVEEGATVPVGAVIGQLGDAAQTLGPEPQEPAEHTSNAPAPAAASVQREKPVGVPAGTNGAGGTPSAAGPALRANGGVKASPLARRTAQALGVDLASVIGSGPNNRILKSDVVAASRATDAAAAPAAEPAVAVATAPAPAPPAPAAPVAAGTQSTVEELSRTQALIARRMAESRATVPEFEVQVDVDMSAAMEIRSRLKQLADPAPSLNDIVVKAAAVALRRHPRANGTYRDGRFELHARVNVGVAVAAKDALIVPTVCDADAKSLGAIAAETRRLIERIHGGKISPPELSGGTFTVSNLGMFGIDRFAGIINAPEAAILCVGAIRERPTAVDGQVVVRPIMSMTLACDHRILYGADAAQFLNEVRECLEQPLTMLL